MSAVAVEEEVTVMRSYEMVAGGVAILLSAVFEGDNFACYEVKYLLSGNVRYIERFGWDELNNAMHSFQQLIKEVL